MDKPICEVHRLGLIDYQEAWDLQNRLAAEIAAGDRLATLLLLEHPHTYTFGRKGDIANLLWDENELRQREITVHWVDRGGDVTYHGPGQLVGYPLLPLGILTPQNPPQTAHGNQIPKADYIGYIRKLEQILIMAVAEFGVRAKQVEGLTGVWVDGDPSVPSSNRLSAPYDPFPIAKLAAIGVKVDASGISRHGFALNVNPDMRYWEGIVGCGLPYPEISLADLLKAVPSMTAIVGSFVEVFGKIFEYEIKYVK